MRAVICKGDRTSHGGRVLEGNPNVTTGGRPIAQLGHSTFCPQCKGKFPIIEGVPTHTYGGKPTAVEGMRTACGATLIASQREMVIDAGGGIAATSTPAKARPQPTAPEFMKPRPPRQYSEAEIAALCRLPVYGSPEWLRTATPQELRAFQNNLSLPRAVTVDAAAEARRAAETNRIATTIGIFAGGPALTGYAAGAQWMGAPNHVVNNLGVAQTGVIGSVTAVPGSQPIFTGATSYTQKFGIRYEPGLGHVTGEYRMLGPIGSNMAETFAGGRYTAVKLERDTLLYRAGTTSEPYGQYFSMESPRGIIQTRVDKAVLPEWPNGAKSTIDTAFGINIPAGTQVYVGDVGYQNGFYMGGTQQVIVPRPWSINGADVITTKPLK